MELQQELGRAIDRALTSTTAEPRYRVFRDGRLDYRACAEVAKSWSCDGEQPSHQLRRIVGDNAVLAINDIASWNHELARCLASDSRSLPAGAAGEGVETVDTYAFVSTGAGWTAFGAHVDFEHSIIIDVEGAGRDVVTWEEGAEYGARDANGRAFFGISFDWESYVSTSTTTTLNPGEIAVVRARQPHIFHANGPGMFLGLSTLGDRMDSDGPQAEVRMLAQGPAFIPSHDAEFRESVLSGRVPSNVVMLDMPSTDGVTLSLGKRSIALRSDELELANRTEWSELVRPEFRSANSAARSLTLKLILIGAAIVC